MTLALMRQGCWETHAEAQREDQESQACTGPLQLLPTEMEVIPTAGLLSKPCLSLGSPHGGEDTALQFCTHAGYLFLEALFGHAENKLGLTRRPVDAEPTPLDASHLPCEHPGSPLH